jgi:hypothetical protein
MLVEAGNMVATTISNDGCMIMLLLMYTIFVLPIMWSKNVKSFVTGKIEMIL